jgi:hypothetical protein
LQEGKADMGEAQDKQLKPTLLLSFPECGLGKQLGRHLLPKLRTKTVALMTSMQHRLFINHGLGMLILLGPLNG